MDHAQRCNEILDMLANCPAALERWHALYESRRRRRAERAESRGEAVRERIVQLRRKGWGIKRIAADVRCDWRFVRRVLAVAEDCA